jgi:hypothetical protein
VRQTDVVGQRKAPRRADGGADPRSDALHAAVARLRRELDEHPAELRDRRMAEDALERFGALSGASVPDAAAMRQALLVTAAAVGSVSALSAGLAELRRAVELFGDRQGFEQINVN